MTAPRKPARNLKDFDGVPWRRLHLWHIQPIRDVLLILTVFGLLYLGYKISIVTVPILLALLLAYLFEPVVAWLTGRFSWMTRRMAAGGLIAVTAIAVIVPLTLVAAWGIAEGTRFGIRQVENASNFISFANALDEPEPDPKKPPENGGDNKNKSDDPPAGSGAASDQGADPISTGKDNADNPSSDDTADAVATDTESDTEQTSDGSEQTEEPEKETTLFDVVLGAGVEAEKAEQAQLQEAKEEIATATAAPATVTQDNAPVPSGSESGRVSSDKASEERTKERTSLTRDEAYNNLTSEAWREAAEFLERQKQKPTGVRFIEIVGGMPPPTMSQVRDYLGGTVIGIFASVSLIGVFGFQLFLTAFFFFFISSGYDRVIRFIENLLPRKHRDRTVDLARKMDLVIAGFVRGRLVIAVIQGVIFSIAYLALGVPAGIILGLVVGILSIVPYLALIGIPISILLLFLDGPTSGLRSEWWFMLFAPIAVYFIVQALDDYVWTPMIQGKSTGLDTPTVLFASIAGGALAGFYGLLIAIPVAACVKILVQEVVWPRFKAWREGKVEDPLPLGGGE